MKIYLKERSENIWRRKMTTKIFENKDAFQKTKQDYSKFAYAYVVLIIQMYKISYQGLTIY